jgi:hypothetical protein
MNTLDEPVSTTIMRDLKAIGWKMKQVIIPKGNTKSLLKDWDLWGPLVLCLTLSIRLSLFAPASINNTDDVFSYSFAIVWGGAAVVTLNAKLLGGKLSFFQSICVLGYCICPLVIISLLLPLTNVLGFPVRQLLKLGLIILAYIWSSYASLGFFSDINLEKKKFLALYPIYFFYFVLSWLVC